MRFGFLLVAVSAERDSERETTGSLNELTLVNELEGLTVDVETGLRGYTITREDQFLAVANAERRTELAASRARVVAAADHSRHRIERDLHDGAQQRLASVGLELRAAQAMVPPGQPELAAQLSDVGNGLAAAINDLQERSRRIHPAILSRGGLGPALKALTRRSGIPVELDLRIDRRLPEPIEVAIYYVVSEALTNAAKHARASSVDVKVEADDTAVHLSVHDDGVGGADPARGSGLVGLRDRVEALGGPIQLKSPIGDGTTRLVGIPLRED